MLTEEKIFPLKPQNGFEAQSRVSEIGKRVKTDAEG